MPPRRIFRLLPVGRSGCATYGGVEDPQQALADAARWAPSTGLSDGIQVGVEPGFAAELGATNATEEALVDQA